MKIPRFRGIFRMRNLSAYPVFSGSGKPPSSGRSFEESGLEEERFYDVFHGIFLLPHDGSESVQSDGPSRKLVRERRKEFAVERIEAELVDSEIFEHLLCPLHGFYVLSHHRIIAQDFYEAVHDSRGSAAFFRYRLGDGRVEIFHSENPHRTRSDHGEFFVFVEIELQHVSETVAKRSGKFRQLSGSANERELGNVHPNG